MHDRIDSVNSLLKREISRIIQSDVKDPRLSTLTSVVSVETSKNLQNSTVYVTVMGEKGEKLKTLKGLRSAGGFIQRSLRKNLDLRTIPSIRFLIDDSLDQAEEISKLLTKAKENL